MVHLDTFSRKQHHIERSQRACDHMQCRFTTPARQASNVIIITVERDCLVALTMSLCLLYPTICIFTERATIDTAPFSHTLPSMPSGLY